MNIERIECGTRMSKAVIHNGTVYLAGQTSDASADAGGQTREILAKIDAYLEKAGTDKRRLLKANIWLSDIAHFAEMNAVWDAWVPEGCAPARATVESRLARADLLVEIQVVAALP